MIRALRFLAAGLAAIVCMLDPGFVAAQSSMAARVVSTCNAQTYAVGTLVQLTMTQGGNLCSNGSGGTGAASPVGYANQTNLAAVTVSASTGGTPVVSARVGAAGTGRGLLILENTTANAAWCTSGTPVVNSGTYLPGVIGASINVAFTGAESCISVGSAAIVSVTELY